jgi:hypothetical protein
MVTQRHGRRRGDTPQPEPVSISIYLTFHKSQYNACMIQKKSIDIYDG